MEQDSTIRAKRTGEEDVALMLLNRFFERDFRTQTEKGSAVCPASMAVRRASKMLVAGPSATA